ncbi:MAG: SDR family oxidoreductase [Capsulimonadales bacterium]|nr:SDR family oxidoreductase [Capsulimonadales bacterium]
METTDPREKHPTPPFDEQDPLPIPGTEKEMTPKADHGEESYRGSGKLEGKVTLITGADSGIGRAVALAFAREGADVAISYLSEEEDARETERLVREAGRRAIRLPGDIADENHCREIIRRTRQEFGRLDVLVNNAAYQKSFNDISEITADELEKTFRINLFAQFHLCKAALAEGGLDTGGAIINTSSVQGYDPSPNLMPYAATKAAIISFTKSLAKQAIKKGIRVNSVAPGPVWTPLIPSTLDPTDFGKDAPIGRPAQPAELAPVFVLLASDQASFIVGATYAVTGGELTA